MRTVSQTRRDQCPRCGAPETVFNGLWLRSKRLNAGIGLRQLARQLELPPSFLSSVERNMCACPDYLKTAYENLQ